MTMETAVKSVFGPMGPTPGAEERIWKAIDKGLHGRAKAAEVRFRPRRAKKPLLIGAAAILALVLLTAAVIRHMPAERPESIHPADEAAEPSPEAEEPVLIPTVRQIALINARVDGKEILDLTEEGRYLARAVLPEGYTVEGIALVVGVDRLFDMGRTVVNITGDASCAIVVSALERRKQQKKAAKA